MILHGPFKIGSNLRPCLMIGGAELSLSWERTNGEGRDVYRWELYLPRGLSGKGKRAKTFVAADLKTGCQGGGLQEMFGALLSFLGAAAESLYWCEREGRKVGPDDNASLFPLPVVKWARDNSDELDMLRCEIEERGETLIEE